MITAVAVQGRYSGGSGREFTRNYKLQYWRTEVNVWRTYRTTTGKEVINRIILLLKLIYTKKHVKIIS